jgi:two-component system, NtrC family, response regulator HydG
MPEICQAPILLVDDDEQFLQFLKSFLCSSGYANVVTMRDSSSVPQLLEKNAYAVIVLDLMLPEVSGHHLLKLLVAQHPTVPVIILTAQSQLETAIDCMREGACDYLQKPLELARFLASIQRALELRSLNEKVYTLQHSLPPERLARSCDFPYIITRDTDMQELLRYVEVIAPSQLPVLIVGETGVGKELFARALHQASRQTGPFIAVNVAGLDDNMFSDTLFGHRKGSYTGAESDREGLVSKAAQGTLFLDEIGELAEPAQVKLLRLIQEQEYYRLGSDTPSRSEARIVIATNRDLKQAMLQGTFRKDLYYRLFAHQVAIPPLRSRQDDLPLLLDYFIGYAAQSLDKPVPSYPKELVTLLESYPFPGNLRELQAMVFEAVARNSSPKLGLEQFKILIRREREGIQAGLEAEQPGCDPSVGISFSHFPTLKEAECLLIDRALELAKSNQGVAATLLGISRQALNRRLQPLQK